MNKAHMNGMKMEVMVPFEEFNNALWSRFNDGKIRNVYPKAKYDHIIQKIKSMEETPPVNSPGEYYLLRKFVVAKVDGEERLACKNLNAGIKNGYIGSKVRFYIALEEIHRFLEEAHVATHHGGRDRIVRHLQDQGVVNIARDTVELFLSFCQICRGRPRQKECGRQDTTTRLRHIVPKPPNCPSEQRSDGLSNLTIENCVTLEPVDNLLKNVKTERVESPVASLPDPEPSPTFRRGHVAILDLSASPDGEFRFILVYLDYQTQFTILRPVKCKCTYEIASHLLDIFTFIGPPQVLHSDYDSPFLITVIQALKQSWPQCVVVVSRDNSNSEMAKHCIADVERMLKDWISESNSHRWSFGLRFVQLRKNTKISGGSGKSPYERFFGKPPQTLPPYWNPSMEKEEELINAVSKHRDQAENCEQLQVSLDPNICSLVQNNVFQEDSQTDLSISEDDLTIDTSFVKTEPPDSDDGDTNN